MEIGDVYAIKTTILTGDAMDPHSGDILAQVGTLDVGKPVPAGWNVLDGWARASWVGRVVTRDQLKHEEEGEDG